MTPFLGGSASQGAAAMQAARQYFGLAHSNVSERFKPQLLKLSNQELMKAMKNGVKVDAGVKKFSGSGLRGIGSSTPTRLMRARGNSFNQQKVRDNQKLFLAKQALEDRDFAQFIELSKGLSEEQKKELGMWSKVDLLYQLGKKIEQVGHNVDGLTLENQFKTLFKKLLFFIVGAGATGYMTLNFLVWSFAEVLAVDIIKFGVQQAEEDIQRLENLLTNEESVSLHNQLIDLLDHIKQLLVKVKVPVVFMDQLIKVEQYIKQLRSEKLVQHDEHVNQHLSKKKQDQQWLQEELNLYNAMKLEAIVSGEPIVVPSYYEMTQSDYDLLRKTFKDYFNVKLFPDVMQSNFMQNQVVPIAQQQLQDQYGFNVSRSEVVNALQGAMNGMLDRSFDKVRNKTMIIK